MLHVKETYESSERWREDERLVGTSGPNKQHNSVFRFFVPPVLICFGFDLYTVVLELKNLATWKFQKVQGQKATTKASFL